MANIKVTFKGNEYYIDESKLASTYEALQLQMTALSDGTGSGSGGNGGSGGDEPGVPDMPVVNGTTYTIYAWDTSYGSFSPSIYTFPEALMTFVVPEGVETWGEYLETSEAQNAGFFMYHAEEDEYFWDINGTGMRETEAVAVSINGFNMILGSMHNDAHASSVLTSEEDIAYWGCAENGWTEERIDHVYGINKYESDEEFKYYKDEDFPLDLMPE